MFVKLLMLVAFTGVTIYVGLRYSEKGHTISGFVLGSFKAGSWLTAFAYGTSYFSAVVFVGYAGQFGWRFGVSALWIGIGNALLGSLLAWSVLARRTRLMSRHLNTATMPAFFGARYDSKAIRKFTSLIAFIFLIPYTASLYNGLSRLFAMAFNLDFSICIVMMAVVTAFYVILGGYTATAINDFIQGIVMILGIVVVLGAVLSANGGFNMSLGKLAQVNDPAIPIPGIFSSMFGPDPTSLLGVVILTSLGTWGLPQMTAKFYAIKSEQNIHAGMIISTVFALIISGGCYLLGGFGRLFMTDVSSGYDAIIPTMLSGFPDAIIGLVIVLVFAASISTLSSLVMACGSTVVLDFAHDSFAQKTEKQRIFAIRILIAFFITLSSVIAVYQYKVGAAFIAQLMGISWGALAGAFLAPFLYGLYGKWVTRAAVWVNCIFAVTVMVTNVVAKSIFPAILASPINCGAFVMISGLVIVPVVSLFTRKLPATISDHAFECLDIEVSATAGSFLADDPNETSEENAAETDTAATQN